jgi:hypothetical protein
MAQVSIPGGVWMPPVQYTIAPALTASALTASGHKAAWIGQVKMPDRGAAGARSITKVGFLPGAITAAGGSTMRLSLQNLDLSTGTPHRPDGTQDQTVDFLISAPTASTFYKSAALSAARSVTHGEQIAVVLEYQTYLGADSFAIQNMTGISAAFLTLNSFLLNTASWVHVNALPSILFEFTDGSFGSFAGGFPLSALNTHALTTATTPDEIALEFQVPFPTKIEGCWLVATLGATRNIEINLYNAGGSTLATVTIDAEQSAGTAARVVQAMFSSEVSLAANTTYRLGFKPTTTAANTFYSLSVDAAGHFDTWFGGQAWKYTARSDGGSWDAATATQRPVGGLILSSVDNGASSGRAGIIGG